MVDIDLFRAERGSDPDRIRELLRQRNASVDLVDEIIRLDREWRKAQFRLEVLFMDFNDMNNELLRLQMRNLDATELINTIACKQRLIDEQAVEVEAARNLLDSKLETIGILLQGSVPGRNDVAIF